MVAAEPVGLSNASSSETCTAGVMRRLEKVFVGLTEKRSRLPAPGSATAVNLAATIESVVWPVWLMDAEAL